MGFNLLAGTARIPVPERRRPVEVGEIGLRLAPVDVVRRYWRVVLPVEVRWLVVALTVGSLMGILRTTPSKALATTPNAGGSVASAPAISASGVTTQLTTGMATALAIGATSDNWWNSTTVAGTSARKGLYRSHAKSPHDWAPDLLKSAQNGKVALVFGPEDKGLSNEHLALCTRIIQIPSHSSYESLNLSHAVMICCYEIFL